MGYYSVTHFQHSNWNWELNEIGLELVRESGHYRGGGGDMVMMGNDGGNS